jgi:hypothetical protein
MAESELSEITEALDRIAAELDSEPDEERAAQLVREASELATKAGEALERAQRSATEAARDS